MQLGSQRAGGGRPQARETPRPAGLNEASNARVGLARLLLGLFTLDFGVCWIWAHPLVPYLLLVALAGSWAAGRPGALAKSARDVAGALLIGVSPACVALIALNTFYGLTGASTVHSVELRLARVRLAVDAWTQLSLRHLLILASALLVLALLATRLQPVKRFEHSYAFVGAVKAVLFVMTSFVIYAQPALQVQVDRVHQRIAHDYHAAFDRKWNAESLIAATNAVEHTIESMTTLERRGLAVAIARDDRASATVADGLSGVPAVESAFLEETPDQPSPVIDASPPVSVVDTPPTSDHDLDRQIQALTSVERQAAHVDAVRAELVPLALSTATRAISLSFPVASESVRIVLDDLTDNLVERLKEKVLHDAPLSRWVTKTASSIASDEERWLTMPGLDETMSDLEGDATSDELLANERQFDQQQLRAYEKSLQQEEEDERIDEVP